MAANIRRNLALSQDPRTPLLRPALYPTQVATRIHLIHRNAGDAGGSLCALRPTLSPWRWDPIDGTMDELCQKCAALARQYWQMDDADLRTIVEGTA